MREVKIIQGSAGEAGLQSIEVYAEPLRAHPEAALYARTDGTFAVLSLSGVLSVFDIREEAERLLEILKDPRVLSVFDIREEAERLLEILKDPAADGEAAAREEPLPASRPRSLAREPDPDAGLLRQGDFSFQFTRGRADGEIYGALYAGGEKLASGFWRETDPERAFAEAIAGVTRHKA